MRSGHLMKSWLLRQSWLLRRCEDADSTGSVYASKVRANRLSHAKTWMSTINVLQAMFVRLIVSRALTYLTAIRLTAPYVIALCDSVASATTIMRMTTQKVTMPAAEVSAPPLINILPLNMSSINKLFKHTSTLNILTLKTERATINLLVWSR